MNSPLKALASLLALALGLAAAAPALRAEDVDVTTPAPAPAPAPAKKGKAAQRLQQAVDARDKALIDKLALTADQQTKLAEIRKSGAEQLKAAAGDRAKLREIAKTQHDQVRAMLTPEQQTTFDAMPATNRAGKGKKAK